MKMRWARSVDRQSLHALFAPGADEVEELGRARTVQAVEQPGPVAGVAFAVVVAGGAGDAEVEIGPGVVLDGVDPASLGRRRRLDDRGLAQTGRADHLGDVLRLFFQQVREG